MSDDDVERQRHFLFSRKRKKKREQNTIKKKRIERARNAAVSNDLKLERKPTVRRSQCFAEFPTSRGLSTIICLGLCVFRIYYYPFVSSFHNAFRTWTVFARASTHKTIR